MDKCEIKFYINGEEVTPETFLRLNEDYEDGFEETEEVEEEEIDDEEYIDNLIEEYVDDVFDVKPDECEICHAKDVLENLFWTAFEMGYNAMQEDEELDED
jgi:hypothetical protein